MKPSTLIAWENGPTGGVSSGEVMAILLMANSVGCWLDGQNDGAGGGARFQGRVSVSGILERKALIDLNAHLSRSHHSEQLVGGGFKLLSARDVVEERRPGQEERTLLRQ